MVKINYFILKSRNCVELKLEVNIHFLLCPLFEKIVSKNTILKKSDFVVLKT